MNNNFYFLIVDTETGGLDPKSHKLLEIGAAVYDQEGEKVDEFHAMLGPDDDCNLEKDITLYALRLNKLAERSVDEDTANGDVAHNFANWLIEISNAYNPSLVGQNINFDIRFIEEFLGYFGYLKWDEIFGVHHIDTIAIAKLLSLKGIIKTKRFSLKHLAEEFNITNPDAHTAMGDVETTKDVFFHMMGLIK
ncbi:MAG: 3'-5' exonuclease [Bacteriovoracaceae bacterium]|nr:3'-5' exonuclease [Bacteriovoracaceae bacterium]